jgi:hypothetical protein
MGVPVGVEDDDGVSGLQVEAQATGAGAEDEEEVVRRRVIEHLQQVATVLRLGHAVQTQVLVAWGTKKGIVRGSRCKVR